jgi:hypothetical protein
MQTLHQGKWYHLYSSLQLVQTDKMIVAITGATGFIGLRLVKRFDAGSSESCAFDEASPSAKDYLGEAPRRSQDERNGEMGMGGDATGVWKVG